MISENLGVKWAVFRPVTVLAQLVLGPGGITEECQSFSFDCVLETQGLDIFEKSS